MLITTTAQKAAVQVSITSASTICADQIQHKHIDDNCKESQRHPNERKRNYFHDWFYEKVDESQHRAGQNKPFPIAIENESRHQAAPPPRCRGRWRECGLSVEA